jgi:hypothetical protein
MNISVHKSGERVIRISFVASPPEEEGSLTRIIEEAIRTGSLVISAGGLAYHVGPIAEGLENSPFEAIRVDTREDRP